MFMQFNKDVQEFIAINHNVRNIFTHIVAEKQIMKVTYNFLISFAVRSRHMLETKHPH